MRRDFLLEAQLLLLEVREQQIIGVRPMDFIGDALIEHGMLGLQSRTMRGLHNRNLLALVGGTQE